MRTCTPALNNLGEQALLMGYTAGGLHSWWGYPYGWWVTLLVGYPAGGGTLLVLLVGYPAGGGTLLMGYPAGAGGLSSLL